MATIDEINILDRKPADLGLILESGRQPIAEPIPPSLSPVRDYFYENILNPEGRKLVDMVRGEINNPLNFMAGAGGISRVGGKGIATLRSKIDDGIGGGDANSCLQAFFAVLFWDRPICGSKGAHGQWSTQGPSNGGHPPFLSGCGPRTTFC